MKDHSKAKIFVASERGHTETEWFRSYNTFNFESYSHEHKSPFGALYILNDDTLAGAKSFQLLAEEDTVMLLVPTVGAVAFTDGHGKETLVQASESAWFFISKDTTIQLANPYEETLVNFLQLWFKASFFGENHASVFAFTIDTDKNKLLPIVPDGEVTESPENIRCYIGKFDGRNEGVFQPANIANGVFVFVIEGAFEVQNRLLETRDGLALWNASEVEFEALSNEAIILVIEIAGASY